MCIRRLVNQKAFLKMRLLTYTLVLTFSHIYTCTSLYKDGSTYYDVYLYVISNKVILVIHLVKKGVENACCTFARFIHFRYSVWCLRLCTFNLLFGQLFFYKLTHFKVNWQWQPGGNIYLHNLQKNRKHVILYIWIH